MALVGGGLVAAYALASVPVQRLASPRRVGFLQSGATPDAFEPFRDGLRDLGYVEGQDTLIERRDAEGNLERLPTLVAELIGAPTEVIVVADGPSAVAATRATTTTPIVASGGNIVAVGLVTNVARPEGNITGVASNSLETVGKRLELLKETVSSISRLAVLVDVSGPSAQVFLPVVQRAAQTLQLHFTRYELGNLDHLPAVLSTLKEHGADGLVVLPGGILGGARNPRIGREVLKLGLPAVAEARDFAVNGGLLAHGTPPGVNARRAATYVDKILKGAKPGDLPIELPTEFHIVVNLRTARELGITIPQTVLAQATEILQ